MTERDDDARDRETMYRELAGQHPELLGDVLDLPPLYSSAAAGLDPLDNLVSDIERRAASIHQQLIATVRGAQDEVRQGVELLLRWMEDGSVVRVVGAGRARLAAAIPAHRLAHGGARVHIQDDLMPMPHTIKGGGIIAASASGKTPAVLDLLEHTRRQTRDVQILGIAAIDANRFRNACDVFVGIRPEPADAPNPLRALADNEEYVISELLDAMVVAACRLAGFGEPRWRLGHENIGATGFYDHLREPHG